VQYNAIQCRSGGSRIVESLMYLSDSDESDRAADHSGVNRARCVCVCVVS
jgi:hypothetical protein